MKEESTKTTDITPPMVAASIEIESYAKSLGFDLVGFSPAKLSPHYIEAYEKWLKEGMHADMGYMEGRVSSCSSSRTSCSDSHSSPAVPHISTPLGKSPNGLPYTTTVGKKENPRTNIDLLLPGAKTVIVLAKNYYCEDTPLRPGFARVARYARSRDYHKALRAPLRQLEEFIHSLPSIQPESTGPQKALDPLYPTLAPKKSARPPIFDPSAMDQPILTKSYIDTGPILERAYAEQADLGQIGKNACLITREFGSWVFLAVVITTLEIATGGESFSKKQSADFSEKTSRTFREKGFSSCGSCTRCIDACPAKAIISPGVIDARKCLAYHTIENRNPDPEQIPSETATAMRKTKTLFGCDICQEVCPHNCRQKPAQPQPPAQSQTSVQPSASATADQLPLSKILTIPTDEQFTKTFAGTPIMRAKRKGLQRNASIIASPPTSNSHK